MIDLPELPVRPLWLMTLADLALLLVGFLVLGQATTLDRAALARGLRAGFDTVADQRVDPVAAGAIDDFAAGSATLSAAPDRLIAWARDAARDPRVRLRITGSVDGSAGDVDPATLSGPLLAADRARTVAAALVAAHAVAPTQIALHSADAPGRRRVLVTLVFAGAPR